MHVARLWLHDFRSYPNLDISLSPGVTAFLGRNGQGKTNLVEAVDYVARLASHRVAADAPLVRDGADRAVVRAAVVRHDREALLEVEINPGRSNRVRVNRAPLPRAAELVGMVRTVLFSPEDLALVKGDPAQRRRFLDDLLTLRTPRFAGVRADYERVLRQRNTLLKSLRGAGRLRPGAGRGGGRDSGKDSRDSGKDDALGTLGVWDAHLARTGSELLAARLRLVEELRPLVGKAYESVARGAGSGDATIAYQCSFELPRQLEEEGGVPDRDELAVALLRDLEVRRADELDRGVSLVGPHRDELTLALGRLPAKGYASHGESWSFALALRLACYELLRAGGDDPILILDDVFAELDTDRRERLAAIASGAEQVLVTAAVPADVPAELAGVRMTVADGGVRPDE